MSQAPAPYHPAWLGLREPADAAARSGELVALLHTRLAGSARLTIHDLGAGTGSMARWLGARLPGPQHWVLHDRDPQLLAHAIATMPERAGDGSPITVVSRRGELAALTEADLAGADLVTTSALLDVLTSEELGRLVTACGTAACPALFTLSVTGEVTLSPADPLDQQLTEAFNDHQRRPDARGRRLLGPDAPQAAADAFTRQDAPVHAQPSPWRLGPAQAELISEWLAGWVSAACQQRPQLAAAAEPYLRRRLAAAAAGELRVTVGHRDLLAYCA